MLCNSDEVFESQEDLYTNGIEGQPEDYESMAKTARHFRYTVFDSYPAVSRRWNNDIVTSCYADLKMSMIFYTNWGFLLGSSLRHFFQQRPD